MSRFPIHTVDSAPADSRPLLEAVQKKLGFIPNMYAGFAESPAVLKAALALGDLFAESSLSAQEQQVVLIAASVENRCEFCVGAHSFLARNVAKVPDADLDALRAGKPLPTPRLNALAAFTRKLVRERGWLDEADVEAILNQGFTRAQLLEVILGVTQKTLTNYANHILKTPLNEQFASERWDAKRQAA